MFALTKWYLDLVTDDGTAIVAWAARLRWGALRLRYGSLLVAEPGRPPVEATTLHGVTDPTLTPERVEWRCAPLDLEGRWLPESPPLTAELLAGPQGAIRWRCHAPNALGALRIGARRFSGRGYVESLDVTCTPMQLPFRTLRWGRHLSAAHAVVWIDWQGGTASHRWVWLDGTPDSSADLTPGGLTGLAPGLQLHLDPARTLRDRRLLDDLAGPMPALARRVIGPAAGMREHKQLARSALLQDGVAIDAGWAVFEEVAW